MPTSGHRLASEKSPYLLQHAGNPVDWYPWGDEAFEKAENEDKPVFLSIGYSTCHWCHVMERESFEDPEVAGLLNNHFVSIKVDREERPDIDNVYMSVCHMMTGGGGWPLTIIMTPGKQPFYAATYIPKHTRFGRIGMLDLLSRIESAWQTQRQALLGAAERLAGALEDSARPRRGDEPGEQALHLGFRQLAGAFDPKNGGFGKGMKFPTPHQLIFLVRYFHRTGNKRALEMAEKTLTEMRRGGIYDHLGFGFHRYSTDPEWLVPHFEKMLYDQALMMLAYVEAYEATGRRIYKETAREIATYVLIDMTSPEGAFYSAEDADSEGVEGKFYLWTEGEIRAVLERATADLFMERFNVSGAGNFESEAGEEVHGLNILNTRGSEEELEQHGSIAPGEVESRLESARQVLLARRETRARPLRDDKVLTDWNGLMIAALSRASRALAQPSLARAAKEAADFVLTRLSTPDGRLLHRYREGSAGLPAHLDDYAYMVFGLIELYQATFDADCLKEAVRLNDLMVRHFGDPREGGFFLTADDTEQILVRPRELYDGALPSGNSVAFYNLVRLSRITGNQELDDLATRTARTFSHEVLRHPSGHAFFLIGLDFALGPSLEVVIAGHRDADDTAEMLSSLWRIYAPRKVVVARPEGKEQEITSICGFVGGQPMVEGRATAYVCVDQSCSLPVTDPDEMVELIEDKTR